MESNPVSSVKLSKENNARVRWLTDDEEAELMKTLPKGHHSIVLINLHAGVRNSDQLNLKWSDINLEQRPISIRESKPVEARRIPMNQVVIEALKRQPRMLHNPFVFFGREDGQPLKERHQAF